jgi:hypothetical protein
MSDVADLCPAIDSDMSGVSFEPDFDAPDDSDSRDASKLTGLSTPEPTCLPDDCSGRSNHPKQRVRRPTYADALPDFNDYPDDDTDEDLADIPLDSHSIQHMID